MASGSKDSKKAKERISSKTETLTRVSTNKVFLMAKANIPGNKACYLKAFSSKG